MVDEQTRMQYPWYYQPPWLVVMCFLVMPVGLVFLWYSPLMTLRAKKILTCICIAPVVTTIIVTALYAGLLHERLERRLDGYGFPTSTAP